ncbi:MAG: 50S ribosomal protein L21 [Bacteroidia bacterium]
MFAIVKIGGHQFKVEKDMFLYVNKLDGKEGSNVDFSEVLFLDNNGKVSNGKSSLEGATVSAKILEHLKGDKVVVFKKKRRKGYKKLNGHRQSLTKIQISGISEKGSKKSEKKAEPKAEAKAEETKTAE